MSNSHHFLADLTWLTPESQHGRPSPPVDLGSSSAIKIVPGSHQNSRAEKVESPESPYYPPPATFMPPESPNMIRRAPHGLPSPPEEWPPVPTRPSQFQYKGVTLAPAQLAHLPAFGKLVPSVTDSKRPSKTEPGVPPTLHKSQSDKWPYFGPLRDGTSASKTSDSDSAPQTEKPTYDPPQPSEGRMTFPELAAKNGAREWNPNLFDDRWLLRPEEVWKVDPRRQSVMTTSTTTTSAPTDMRNIELPRLSVTTTSHPATQPLKAPPADNTISNTIQIRRRSSQGMGQGNGHDYTTDPLGAYAALLGIVPPSEGKQRKSMDDPASALILDADLLPEMRRFEGVFREHADANFFLPQGLPYERDSIREIFQISVFGTKDARTLSEEDAALRISYGSNIITRGELHDYLFRVLDCMAEDMTTPRKRAKSRSEPKPRATGSNLSDSKTALAYSLLPDDRDSLQSHSNHRSGQFKLNLPGGRQVGKQMMYIAPPSDSHSRYGVQPQDPDMQSGYDHFSDHEYHQQQINGPLRYPASYYQNFQAPKKACGHPNLPQAPSINPGYGRQTAFHTSHTTMPAHFQATRPAAPQRLAPTILRAGALGFVYDCTNSPDITPRQSYVDLIQSTQQCNLSSSSESSEVLQPTAFSSSYESTKLFQPPAFSISSPSMQNWQPMRDFVSPAPSQKSQSLRNAAIRDAVQFSQHSRSSTPAGSVASSIPITQSAEWEHRFGLLPSKPTLVPLPYHAGIDITKSQTVGGSSISLQELTRHGNPTYATAISKEIAPFEETAKESMPSQWGVLRIGNIPYSLTRAEVATFLGRNAKLVTPEFGSPIHIIMDRSTGKTNDCYVEFFSNGDAQAAVNKLRQRNGQIKIGTAPNDRVVTVEMSSQDALLKELFPRAKNVIWKDGKPTIEKSTEPYNSGFKAFVTGEEMIMLVRHAEQPHRSSYTQKCPQRTFETMISTLTKFPWHAVQNYTVATRNQIFSATRDQIKILVNNLKRGGSQHITQNLLTELMIAGLNTPGFSERQRWELVQISEYVGNEVKLSPLMKWWPWEAIGRKAGIEEDVVEFYASLFKSHPKAKDKSSTQSISDPFGDLPLATSAEMHTTTMADMGRAEWNQIQGLLRDVLS